MYMPVRKSLSIHKRGMLHGSGILWLGANGWIWYGITIAVGGYGVLEFLPEQICRKLIRFFRSTK